MQGQAAARFQSLGSPGDAGRAINRVFEGFKEGSERMAWNGHQAGIGSRRSLMER